MPEEPTDEPTGATDTGSAPDGRQRLRRSLFTPSRTQLVIGVLLAALGFAAVSQVLDNEVDDKFTGLRQQDLIDILDGLAGARQRAENERDRLLERRDELRTGTDRTKAAIKQAEEETNSLKVLAGTEPVTGPGIRVTISEDDGQIRLSTMLDVIQELRTVGAEAMQVNGEVRVVAQTAIEDVDGGFEVDGELISPPYVIDAIGETNLLAGAITFADGPRLQVEDDGGSITVDQLDSLTIESVRKGDRTDYAAPDPDQ